jgi:hypothetical protein
MNELAALVKRIACGPAIPSACGTAPRERGYSTEPFRLPHTTAGGFDRAKPPPAEQPVDRAVAERRHARLREQTSEERAVMNLEMTIKDATACRLDMAIVLDIWRRAFAAYQGDEAA